MKVELELTDEQVEWARSLAVARVPGCTEEDCMVASAIVAALPQPTLREQAYKVVHPNGVAMPPRWLSDLHAIQSMARWLYENAGEAVWYVGRSEYEKGYAGRAGIENIPIYFDSLVDAYAHVVVGLGDEWREP